MDKRRVHLAAPERPVNPINLALGLKYRGEFSKIDIQNRKFDLQQSMEFLYHLSADVVAFGLLTI
jgi:hypothetical protein